MNMERKEYILTPLTCIHIGTGEEITSLEYKIEKTKYKKPLYCKFSDDNLLQRILDDKQDLDDFNQACKNRDKKYFHDTFTKDDLDYFCDVTEDFIDYTEDRDPHNNAMSVFQMYRTRGLPVIPGSSLKGSIRTALLNKHLNDLNDKDIFMDEGLARRALLDYNDPLRTVCITDSSFGNPMEIQLVGRLKQVSLDKKTERLRSKNFLIAAEMIKGTLLGGNVASKLHISINNNLSNVKHLQKITFDDIRESCNSFYWQEFENEYDTFYQEVNDDFKLINRLGNLLRKVKDSKRQFMVRVGRWSQFEFVTLDKLRRLEMDGKKNSTTRTLFYNEEKDVDGKHSNRYYLPMGWCVLSAKEE